jgi:hypothetical protein
LKEKVGELNRSWAEISKYIPNRDQRQCRLRWDRLHRSPPPEIISGAWTQEVCVVVFREKINYVNLNFLSGG